MCDTSDRASRRLKHPAVLYQIHEGGPGHEKGARYYIEDVVEDRFFFRNMDDARDWAFDHGILFINEHEMDDLRLGLPDDSREDPEDPA
jgi:hypothetical protein